MPNVEIDFHFDRIDFACALATKYGQFKEYKIKETPVNFKVPYLSSSALSNQEDELSDPRFPFEIGCNDVLPTYQCNMLSGRYRAMIPQYEYGKEYTIVCDPYEHTDFKVTFPVNDDLYRSLKYEIENDDYLETMIYLTYKVIDVNVDGKHHESILSGYVHGSVLFYDIDMLGKYVELIRPMVGDIVEIDFPDDKNREKYEITECYDKQLTQDGINPLLHKYIWKCKARRYTNSYEENTPQTEADDRVDEMHKYNSAVDEEVAEAVSMYDTLSGNVKEDAVYGGYDGLIDEYDKQAPGPYHEKYDFIDDGTAIDLIRFSIGSRLVTNGYDLLFMTSDGDFY